MDRTLAMRLLLLNATLAFGMLASGTLSAGLGNLGDTQGASVAWNAAWGCAIGWVLSLFGLVLWSTLRAVSLASVDVLDDPQSRR